LRSRPKKFDPDEDFGVVRGHTEHAYTQGGWYYDIDLQPIEELEVGHPNPMRVRLLEKDRRHLKPRFGDLGRVNLDVEPAEIRRARKENEKARAAEELAD